MNTASRRARRGTWYEYINGGRRLGLFSRSRNKSEGESTPESPGPAVGSQPRFGHAAFTPDDVEDARRGHPAVTLEAFAHERGLTSIGQAIHNGFTATQPAWPDYTFNVSVGALPSGRFGLVSHELLELAAVEGGVRQGGALFDVRVVTRRSASEFVGFVKERPNEPFAANAVWVPSTAVHVRTPEIAPLPPITVKRKVMQGFLRDPVLDDYGVPGYMMPGGRGLDDGFVAAVAERLRPYLPQRNDPWIRLEATHGVVSLAVNGYRADPGDLDHLIQLAEGIANALSELAPDSPQVAFSTLGPEAGAAPWPTGMLRPHPLLVNQYAEEAKRLGMHNEDVTHLLTIARHRPMPGLPSGVLAGNFPGTSTMCRLVWTEQGGRTSGVEVNRRNAQ
ncbi:MAG: hypothetical protein DCC49_05120 [Acidobacteria bacterium]|nr:MAG: hypothetical protein DCC49_05120 [Acidobacteriota bacterium]